MRLSALIHEAARNITSGTTRLTIFGCALALVVGGLTLVDALTIAQQVSLADKFRQAGGATMIITAQSGIDGNACEDLTETLGVNAAGALRESPQRITVSTLPDAPLPLYEITPGFLTVISVPVPSSAGLFLSSDIAKSLAVDPGESIETDSGKTQVAATFPYPADGRRPGLGYAALSTADSHKPFDECWATAWPQITNLRALLLTTVAPHPDADQGAERPRVSQLNGSLGESPSGDEAFLDRTTRGAAPLTGLIALLLGYVAIRLRRLQLASALHSGVKRLDLLTMQLVEACVWSVPAVLVGLSAAATATQLVPDGDQHALFLSVLSGSLAGFVGAIIGTAVGTITTSEKHVFRYFKDR